MSWLSSFLGTGKQKTTNTTTGGVDAESQKYIDWQRGQAQQYAQDTQAGPNMFAGPTQSFQQGLGALQNMPQYAQQFMNPYQDQVISGMQGDFDRQRQMAMQSGAQQATGAGAFGGSRQAVLQANLMGDVNRNEASTLAGLRQSGYNNAMGFGMQNAGALMGGGEAERNIYNQQLQSPYMQRQQAFGYAQGGLGPTGYNQSSTTVQPGQSPFGMLAGGAMTYAGMGGKIPGFGGGGMPPMGAPDPRGFAPPAGSFGGYGGPGQTSWGGRSAGMFTPAMQAPAGGGMFGAYPPNLQMGPG